MIAVIQRCTRLALILLIAVLAAPAAAHAQSTTALRFRHLSTSDGLANNHVEAILHDRHGFAWLGTWDGLSRFDGYATTTYRNDPQDSTSLSSNVISDIFEDRDGRLWIGTRDAGVNRFDPATNSFMRLLDQAAPGSGNLAVHAIGQDQAGTLWFGKENGTLAALDPASQRITIYRQPASAGPPPMRGPVWDLWVDPAGAVWLAGGDIAKFEPATSRLTIYASGKQMTVQLEALPADQPPGGAPPAGNQPPGGANPPPPNDAAPADPNAVNARALYADSAGRLWVAGTGLYRFDPATGLLSAELTGSTAQLNAITGAANGMLWLGGLDGLLAFDPATNAITQRQRHHAAFTDSLAADTILYLTTDPEGVIWIGTADSGVDTLDLHQAQFAFYRDDPLSNDRFAGHQFGALIEDPQDPALLWIANGPLIQRFNRLTGAITTYDPAPSHPMAEGPPEAGNITALVRDQQGMLWFDGVDGVYRLDPASAAFTRYQPADSGQHVTVWTLAEAGAGQFWVSIVDRGLYRFDAQTGAFTSVLSGRDPSGLATNDIRTLHVTAAGDVWLGTSDGVGRYTPASPTLTTFRRPPTSQPGPANDDSNAPSGWAQAIYAARDGRIWVGTSNGLYGLNQQNWTRFTERDGLPSRSVTAIEEDGQGNLWLSTTNGLVRFMPRSATFRVFDSADGVQGTAFNVQSHYQSPSGELWFGGLNGLTAFVPERIADSAFQPPVVLTSVQLANQEVAVGPQALLKQPSWQTRELTLAHDQDILSFGFAALSYSAPAKNRYQYMLDGFEAGWNSVDSNRRFATYTNLPAGSYVFRVRGSNSDGVWSAQEVALALTILPPWWETWWFRSLAVALLLGAAAAGFRWRMYAMRQRNRQLEREVGERTGELVTTNGLLREARDEAETARTAAEEANQAKSVFLANMSHELRSPLNAILGFAQVMARSPQIDPEQREHVGIIRRSGEHLLALINQVLDLSKIEANRMALHERDLDLHQLLDDLEDMFSLRAEEKDIQLLFERSPATPRYIRGDDLKLRQVLINLLNNAIKFTDEGGVAVRVAGLPSAEPGACRLRVEIEDSGPGIAPEELAGLFEAFTQTASGRQAQEGTGLGLPISRRFVQLMGGDIQVRSEPGHGSVFSFEIEVASAAASALAARPSRRQVIGLAPGQPRPRILVADDKWNNRQLLIRLLEPLGFEVREAEDGLQAIEVWEEWQPQLIWMDMRMPRLSGYDAATQIKSTTKGQAVVIVALTASTLEEERAMVLSAGCDEFMRKPFRENDIFEIMQKHLGLRYLYNDEPAARTDESSKPITAQDLAALPAAWRTDLRQAVVALDLDRMLALVETIRPQQPRLAAGLTTMINAFAYEPLAATLEQAEKQAPDDNS